LFGHTHKPFALERQATHIGLGSLVYFCEKKHISSQFAVLFVYFKQNGVNFQKLVTHLHARMFNRFSYFGKLESS